MWIVFLLLLLLPLSVTPAFAEPGLSEKYERDYNIFNPASKYAPDNPFNPANRYDPGNPVNPANRYSPNNPFNPTNQYNPQNPLNPANRYSGYPLHPRCARGQKMPVAHWQG